MTVFVFVAGAFHGGWAWTRLGRLLTAAGQEVHRPDLAGQGMRLRDATPETGLADHIQDIVDYLEFEDLSDVVLVGHSYSGMVVTGAADRARSRISRIVYLDAMVPRHGESAAGLAGHETAEAARSAANGDWCAPFFLPIAKFGPFADDAEQCRFLERIRPHPIKTFFDPISLTLPAHPRRSFIYCTGSPLGIFDQFAEAARTSEGWTYDEIETGHDPMLSAPEQLAKILMAIAGEPGRGVMRDSGSEAQTIAG